MVMGQGQFPSACCCQAAGQSEHERKSELDVEAAVAPGTVEADFVDFVFTYSASVPQFRQNKNHGAALVSVPIFVR